MPRWLGYVLYIVATTIFLLLLIIGIDAIFHEYSPRQVFWRVALPSLSIVFLGFVVVYFLSTKSKRRYSSDTDAKDSKEEVGDVAPTVQAATLPKKRSWGRPFLVALAMLLVLIVVVAITLSIFALFLLDDLILVEKVREVLYAPASEVLVLVIHLGPGEESEEGYTNNTGSIAWWETSGCVEVMLNDGAPFEHCEDEVLEWRQSDTFRFRALDEAVTVRSRIPDVEAKERGFSRERTWTVAAVPEHFSTVIDVPDHTEIGIDVPDDPPVRLIFSVKRRSSRRWKEYEYQSGGSGQSLRPRRTR